MNDNLNNNLNSSNNTTTNFNNGTTLNNANLNNNMNLNNSTSNSPNNEEKVNKYADYLPENRYKNEETNLLNLSPKNVKRLLSAFYVFLIIIGGIVALHFYGYDVFKVEERNYNMNLLESINLSNIYKSNKVEWIANNDNVQIKNNIITAVKSGKSYIYGQKDGKIVKDLTLNILTGEEQMSIDNHAIVLSLKDSSKIKINGNYKEGLNNNSAKSKINKILFKIKNIFSKNNKKNKLKVNPINNNEETTNNNNNITDTQNNSNNNVSNNNSNNNTISNDDDDNSNNNYIEEEYDDEEEEEEDPDYYTEDNTETDSDADPYINEDPSEEEYEEASEEEIKHLKELEEGITEEEEEPDNTEEIIKEEPEEEAEEEQSTEETDGEITLNAEEFVDNTDFEFSSSNKKVATVDEEGIITPVNPGTTTITVTDEYGNVDHTVVTIKEDDLITYLEDYKILTDESINIDYTLDSLEHTESDIIWTSSDENIVKVDENGRVTAISTGQATINIKVGSFEKNINFEVLENETLPTDINISKEEITLEIGEEDEITASVEPENTNFKDLKWIVLNDSIAEFIDNKIIAKDIGNTKAYVIAQNGIKKEITINVTKKEIPLEDIEIVIEDVDDEENNLISANQIITKSKSYLASTASNNSDVNIKIGKKKKIKVNIKPKNATNQNISMEYNTKYITAESKEDSVTITAVKAGESQLIITTESNNKEYNYKIVTKSDIKSVDIDKEKIELSAKKTQKVKVTVSPEKVYNDDIIWKSSNEKIATVDSDGNITAIKKGKAKITAVSSVDSTKKDSVTVTVSNEATMWIDNMHQVYFLSTSGYLAEATQAIDKFDAGKISKDKVKEKATSTGGQSIIIKSANGHIALLDAAEKKENSNLCKYIEDQIYAFAKEGNVTENNKAVLDYFVISHYHGDHTGCAAYIINSKKIKIKKLVIKEVTYIESGGDESTYANLANNKNIAVYYTNKQNDGDSLKLGNSKIYLYNVKDVFAKDAKKCRDNNNKDTFSLKFYRHSSSGDGLKIITIDKKNNIIISPKNKLSLTLIPKKQKNKKEYVDNYYYGTEKEDGSHICNCNANSIVLLAEFPTKNGNKYAYLPSDLENNGISFFGTKYKGTKIYGNGTTYNFAVKGEKIVKKENVNVIAPSEYLTAKKVAQKLGSANLKNILIYQSSHHGHNDDPTSLRVLGLIGRNDLYVVKSSRGFDVPNGGDIRSKENLEKGIQYFTTTKLRGAADKPRKNKPKYRSKDETKVILSINDLGEVIANRANDNERVK